ncbi:unnamed protein product, partial [Oppiella nova]
EGRVVESGGYDELAERGVLSDHEFNESDNQSKGSADQMSRQISRVSESESTAQLCRQISMREKNETKNLKEEKESKEKDSKLIEEETREFGSIKFSVYLMYWKEMGLIFISISIMTLIIFDSCEIGANFWLNQVVMRTGAAKASEVLHKDMLSCILRTPLSFFDVTPLGRIINRFNRDFQQIDENIPFLLDQTLLLVLERDKITPGLAGFLLMYAIDVINSIAMSLRMGGQLETEMVCVERVKEYTQLEPEYSWESTDANKPSEHWPRSASIEFIDYSASYRPGLEPVLKNLNFRVEPGEKVGIVGRTGAGKSSITLALFRIIEPTFGQIVIDGVDVTRIGLHDLRSKLTIIPQEPNLFAGTLRLNLDPFEEYSDEELWTSLERAHLKDFISHTSDGLSYEITESGDNLSAGQRQLVCLSRALLRHSKILILDEATAACDLDLYHKNPIYSPELFDSIWIQRAHLKDFISHTSDGLSYEITESGDNLSAGQRQLVCLSRALLRHSKILILDEATAACILILDEATAACDLETDSLIQSTIRDEFSDCTVLTIAHRLNTSTIRDEFSDCTVLTIAHRLNTVLDYNKILVLDNGVIAEMDSPNNLLKRPDSLFYGLAKEFGIVYGPNVLKWLLTSGATLDVFSPKQCLCVWITFNTRLNVTICSIKSRIVAINYSDSRHICPMNDFNIFSKIFIVWLKDILKHGYKTNTDLSQHLLPICDYIKSKNAFDSYESMNRKYNSNPLVKEIRLLPMIWWTCWVPFTVSALMEFGNIAAQFIQPYILSKLIDFVSESDHLWHGLCYAMAYCFSNLLARLFDAHSYLFISLAYYRVKSSLITALYRKMLKLSASSRREYTTGEINNIMGVDIGEVCDLLHSMTTLYSIPTSLGIGVYILWQQLGPSSLTMFGVMLVVGPFTTYIMKRIDDFQTKQMELKDKRMEQISEVLNNVKLLKLFGWEKPFIDRISKTRREELHKLGLTNNYWAIMEVVWTAVPMIIAGFTFTVFTITSGLPFTAKTAFVSLSVFNLLRAPMARLPNTLTHLTRAIVSFRRIRKYLSCEELDESLERRDDSSDERYAVCLKKCCFSWGLEEEPILKDITLNVKKGSLVAIVGRVGSGKSSLFSALMGDMYQMGGSRSAMRGSVSYVPQSAWIQNLSLRQNIVFVSDYDRSKYERVVEACALDADFNSLPAKDLTEIGEKGINLSGGQKHRVSLARAVYHGSDIY